MGSHMKTEHNSSSHVTTDSQQQQQ